MTIKEGVFVLIFYIIITLIFFYKIFFGLIPLPTDLIVGAYHPWLNYKWEDYTVGVPVQNSKLSDAVSLYYPFKSLVVDFVKKGDLPLWNPYMFGGYPLFANVQVGSLFPTMIFYLFTSSHIAWTLQVISQPILACFFMYLLLRHINLDKFSSFFGGIVYGFGGSTILWIQWNTQATTSLFLPILILFLDKYLISKKSLWGVLLSIFLCLQILAGYLPILLFTYLALGIWYLFRSKNYLANIKIVFYIILGVLLSAVFLLPAAELIQLSQRTVETLNSDVPFFAPENLINLIAPDFFGNPATGNFWGRGDNMDTTIYVGITTLAFSLIGIKRFFEKKEVKFSLLLLILTLIISISNPLSIFLYELGIWGGPSITMNRANFLINFCLAILGSYGFSLLFKDYKLSIKPSILILSICLGLLAGLIWSRYILFKAVKDFHLPISDIEPYLNHINIGLRNIILPFLIAFSLLLLIFFINRFKLFKSIGYVCIIIILIAELFRFGLKFNTFSTPSFIYPDTPLSDFLKKYPNDRFVAEPDIFPANMWLPFKLSSFQGYDGVYPINAAKLLAVVDSNDIDGAPKPRWGIIRNFNSEILDITNTRFLVTIKWGEGGKPSSEGQVSVNLASKYKEVFQDRGVAVLENTQSLPRVYLTQQVIKKTDRETLKSLIDKNFPIDKISISDEFEYNNSSEKLESNLTYTSITNSHTAIQTISNIDSYLVVLDSFYPGWKAFIDGKETKIYRTNYNFRGIFLPKGNHNVEFVYQPKSLEYGAIISTFSLLTIILILVYPKISRKIINLRKNSGMYL